MKESVLLLDDDFEIVAMLKSIIGQSFECTVTRSCKEALTALSQKSYALAFLDLMLPDGNGLTVLDTIRKEFNRTNVIMISGAASFDDAVTAVKLGAYDFLEKPLSADRIQILLRNLTERRKLINSLLTTSVGEIATENKNFKATLALAQRVANSNAGILIRAESGAGKDLLARFIHSSSDRRVNPMVQVNCSAVPEQLFESEFFGHEKGAFTGANQVKHGKFECADKSTLFLDEIGELPLSQQAKLLRVLEEGKITRIGAEKPIPIDTRIICATNQDLKAMIANGAFREDLYFRLNVISLYIPPLRERPEDIGVLANHFLQMLIEENGTEEKSLSGSAIEQLKKMPLPGNARELRNIIQRVYYLSENAAISAGDINLVVESDARIPDEKTFDEVLQKPQALAEARRTFERHYISLHLKNNNYNISHTARVLNMIPNNLFRRIKELNITLPDRP
jgi:two-component system, NtrC family, nitrogen regulation response regulator NtrX